jgi:chromosome segregation ATPase
MNHKIIALTIVASTLLLACNQGKVDELSAEKAAAEKALAEKDSLLNGMFRSFNEIQENLDAIKEREGIMKMRSTENQQDLRENITQDIQQIEELMKKNNQELEVLKARLSSSNVKLAEFQKLINSLKEELAFKDQQLVKLRSLLDEKKIEIGKLYFALDSLTFANEMKDQKIKDQEETINTAYYAYGTYKELKEKNVLTKEGGFLGLGRKEDLKNNFNKEYFSRIDKREQKSFLIYAKKAELVTNHPDGSYEFRGDKGVDSLVILDVDKFWRASKYCVIVVN